MVQNFVVLAIVGWMFFYKIVHSPDPTMSILAVSIIIIIAIYTNYKAGLDFADINAEGISDSGEVIPCEKIERIQFNGDKAYISMKNSDGKRIKFHVILLWVAEL
ncbi:MAG: hypothetical protein AAGU23_01570, partial [Bacillota bacterium]